MDKLDSNAYVWAAGSLRCRGGWPACQLGHARAAARRDLFGAAHPGPRLTVLCGAVSHGEAHRRGGSSCMPPPRDGMHASLLQGCGRRLHGLQSAPAAQGASLRPRPRRPGFSQGLQPRCAHLNGTRRCLGIARGVLRRCLLPLRPGMPTPPWLRGAPISQPANNSRHPVVSTAGSSLSSLHTWSRPLGAWPAYHALGRARSGPPLVVCGVGACGGAVGGPMRAARQMPSP